MGDERGQTVDGRWYCISERLEMSREGRRVQRRYSLPLVPSPLFSSTVPNFYLSPLFNIQNPPFFILYHVLLPSSLNRMFKLQGGISQIVFVSSLGFPMIKCNKKIKHDFVIQNNEKELNIFFCIKYILYSTVYKSAHLL